MPRPEPLEELDANALLEEAQANDAKGGEDEDKDNQGEADDKGGDDKDTGSDNQEEEKGEPERKEDPKEDGGIDLKAEADKLREENPLANIKDDWEPQSYKELLEMSAKVADYNRKVEEAEKKAEEAESTKQLEATRKEIQKYYDKEVNDLIKEGRLPKIKNPDDKDDEGVNTQEKIWRFMLEHNDKASKAGDTRYQIMSFRQALDLYELKQLREEQEEEKKREGDLAKKRGGMIGSGGSKTGEAKGVGYLKGQSLDDVLQQELQDF